MQKNRKYAKKSNKKPQKFAQIKKKQYICRLIYVRMHKNNI